MKILPYDWWCPLCGKQGAFIGGVKQSDLSWDRGGAGTAVCTKCAKERKQEIIAHNHNIFSEPIISYGRLEYGNCKDKICGWHKNDGRFEWNENLSAWCLKTDIERKYFAEDSKIMMKNLEKH
jgi:hypothetical protein